MFHGRGSGYGITLIDFNEKRINIFNNIAPKLYLWIHVVIRLDNGIISMAILYLVQYFPNCTGGFMGVRGENVSNLALIHFNDKHDKLADICSIIAI